MGLFHIRFFDFFKTYSKRRTHIQFLDVIEYVEDQEKRAKILDTYNKWSKSKKATKYWKQRDQANNGNADKNDVITKSNSTSTGSITLETTETVESVTLDEAKKIISENLTLCDNSTDGNQIHWLDLSVLYLSRWKRRFYPLKVICSIFLPSPMSSLLERRLITRIWRVTSLII